MVQEVRRWLEELGLGEYADAFDENRIDSEVLSDLTGDDLKDIGVKAVGDRRKLLSAIAILRESDNPPARIDAISDGASVSASDQPAKRAERRQLTVMFCDLVGSTALSRELDPEDLRDVMRRYQGAVAGAVAQYGGYVAKFLGDGVLAYFGWPQAYEDQAERAVRAGMDAVEAVATVNAGDGVLSARVGLATGDVVVGELSGEAGAIVGETPNLAARLQNEAAPGEIVTSASTRHLIAGIFELTEIGAREMRGFAEPVTVWRVDSERVTESRFDALHSGPLTRFVGRENDMGLLLDRWKLARNGQGQVVLIGGEAGIGKSRLSETFRSALTEEPHLWLRYQCSPYHSNSAFYPTIQQLEWAAGFEDADSTSSKLDKLEALIEQTGDENPLTLPLFANLLSLPDAERYGVLNHSPEEIKQLTLRCIVGHLTHLSQAQPVLFHFEDVHWIDPTSQDLLELAVEGIQGANVMILVTHRPEWSADFVHRSHVSMLQLNRLDERQGEEIARSVAGNEVSDELIKRIVERTDGIPLFVEEVTKAMLESGFDAANSDVPSTLQASLLARLDRLGPEAKDIAQVGAVIGRQFPHELIAAAAGYPPKRLSEALDRLIQSELVFRRGQPPDAEYTFKHALVLDAAYDSMLRDERRKRHLAIAKLLHHGTQTPEMVAEHFEKAGNASQAAELWHEAARQAVSKSANQEALHFCERAATQIRTLPETEENSRRLLAVLILEMQPCIFLVGYASPEIAARAERALVICREVGSDEEMFRILFYRWAPLHSITAGVLALEAAEEYLQRALASGDDKAIIIAHRLVGTSMYMNGRWHEARDHLNYVVENYRPEAHDELAMQISQDVLVAGQIYLALTLWTLGWPDQALALYDRITERAIELDHVNTIAFSKFHLLVLRMLMRTQENFLDEFYMIAEMAKKQGNSFATSFARVVAADLDFRNGKIELAEFEQAIKDLIEQQHTYYGCQPSRQEAVEVCLSNGRIDEAERLVDAMERNFADGFEIYRESEVTRMRGLCAFARGEFVKAETLFNEALEWSKAREAKSYELRAAMSLARFWQKRKEPERGRKILARTYDWFTEGLGTPDLIEAKALLDDLRTASSNRD
jgi:class 3 adenylate cyclase/tetratricopeptide (TPR) repeat protein